MSKRIVRFCYRKIIEAASSKQWDKYVFESSYKEYLDMMDRLDVRPFALDFDLDL